MPQDDLQTALVDPSAGIPDPTQLAGQVQQQGQQNYERLGPQAYTSPQARLAALQAFQQSLNPQADPRVQQATQQRKQLMGIMQDVNAKAPDNEDPLDYQSRLSAAIMRGFAGSNPNVALSAAQNLTRIQNAKSERDKLLADTQRTQAMNAQEQYKLRQLQTEGATDAMYFMDPSDPMNNKPLASVPRTDDKGQPRDPLDMAQEMQQVRAKFPNAVPMTSKQVSDAKAQVAAIRANATIQAAYLRAQAAMMKGEQPSAKEQQDFAADSRNNATLAGAIGQFSDFLDQHPFSNTWGAFAGKFFGNLGAQAQQETSGRATADDLKASSDALSGISVPVGWQTQAGVYKSMIANLGWIITNSSFKQRITNAEIQQAHAIIGDSPNPQQIQTNLAEFLQQRKNQWDNRLIGSEKMQSNPFYGQTQQYVGGVIGDTLNRVRGRITAKPSGNSDNSAPKAYASEADAQAARQRNEITDGSKITIGGRKATWHD